MQLLYVDPKRIEHDPEGVREDGGDVTGLAETIRDQGMLQPLGVVSLGREHYRVVYGGRRLEAAVQLGLDLVPCIVLDADDPDLFLRQLIENVQRRDLNDMEKARAFRRLREQLISQEGQLAEGALDERIAQAVGIAPRTVRRYLGLLDLPEEVQQLIREEELTVTQAQHLRRISQPRTQIELAQLAADEGLSAADVSTLANYFAANPNLRLDTALQALQDGSPLGTKAPREAAEPTRSSMAAGAQETDPGIDSDFSADDVDDIDADGQAFAHLEADEPASRTKARVFRIRSLDQMVDEADRLARAHHEGDLRKWVKNDEAAAFKVGLLHKQLRSLSRALEQLAGEYGWPLADE